MMKRVRITTGTIGLVFKNDNYQRFLTAGTYWLRFRESVHLFHLGERFNSPIPLEILEQDTALTELWNKVEVQDYELAIVHENGLFKTVLAAGRYVFWKGLIDYTFKKIDLRSTAVISDLDSSLFKQYALNVHVRMLEVAAYEKGLLLVDDVYTKTLTAGRYRFWRNDTSIKIAKVDMRQRTLEVSGQELLTKDKATVRLNFDAQFKVVAIEKALLDNKDYEKQLYTVLQLALRAYVGTYTLDELLESKEALAKAVFADSKLAAEKLGVSLLNCGVRDVILTGEMKEIMNRVLIAQKTAQANVITRREETASTRSLLNTAKLMEDNEMLYKLKEMEYVEKIADKIGEITVSGNGGVVHQLKDIFAAGK